MPIDLIFKRSENVRQKLHRPGEDEAKSFLDFSETPIRALEHFVVWVYAAEPTINAYAKFEDVVELAIFANNYFIEALHNQALDILRQKLGNESWGLQPHIVERVYRVMNSDTPLRNLFRVLLNTAQIQPRQNGELQEEMDSWAAVFDTSTEIGKDFYVATCRGYNAHQVQEGGPCRFHQHRDPNRRDINGIGDTVCPFQRGACFAEWDKHAVPEDLDNEKREATTAVPGKTSKKKKKAKKAATPLPNNDENNAAVSPIEGSQLIQETAFEAEPSFINQANGTTDR